MKLVLGNSDYRGHVTDEGWQLQEGLRLAGWTLAGRGLEIDEVDVPTILKRTDPEIVFVQDCRDWRRDSPGCFDTRVSFRRIEALKGHPSLKITVVKDAGSLVDYQRNFAESIGAEAILHYYDWRSVGKLSPWLLRGAVGTDGLWRHAYRPIRIWHTVDSEAVMRLDLRLGRWRGIVTGAVSGVYPLRAKAFALAKRLKIDSLTHPGYGNGGCRTPGYLEKLSRYRVHVATASRYGFALRKIIESVAVGTTPVTDLPASDVLPEIDEALVRISPGSGFNELKRAIDEADRHWDLERALHYSRLACEFYDYRAMGNRTDRAISQLMERAVA